MPLQPPSTETSIVPFWNRLRAISLYPAQMGSLVTIVLLALAGMAAYLPFGRILSLLVTVAAYRYAFSCLRATANGYMQPPEVAMADGSLGWKQIALMVILVLVAALGAALYGPAVGVALLIFVGICLPGATMTLAMEESLLAALDPDKWLSIMRRIGWPYLAVVGLCLVVSMSQGYASAFAARFLPGPVAVITVGFVSNYALVLTFHLMGYLLYQYHEAIGFVPDAPHLSRRLAKPDPDQDVLDEAAQHVRDGKPEVATQLLRGHIRARGGTPAVHTHYRKLLRVAGDNAELLRHGRESLPVLLAQERKSQALDLLRECQALDPAFMPDDAGDVTQLAQAAAKLGQPQVALRLLAGFHKRFPKSRDTPQNYLLAATLLHERMGQDEQARTLLEFLKKTYPADPLAPEVQGRLDMIERISQAVVLKKS